jgi:dihydroorotase
LGCLENEKNEIMKVYLIKSGTVVNRGKSQVVDILIKDGKIEKIGTNLSIIGDCIEIDASGMYVMPGCIDDQVHFREPGLTHKATIYTESRAAAAGGITSFMEMPNTVPNTLTQELLEEKYQLGATTSLVNYSFFMGASNDNIEEVLKTDGSKVCGLKIFMGSSTGNMLVDNEKTLEQLFQRVPPLLIATHCEDEATVRANIEKAREQYGEDVPIEMHPVIRNTEACYLSSSLAVRLAKQYGTRLHVLHISTEKELELFDNTIPLEQKKITAEACIHHMWFSDKDYAEKGNFIKWNPAVKAESDRQAIVRAVLDDRIDVIATDHAPHTIEEKQNSYFKAPSGGPLVQHALLAMMDFVEKGTFTVEQVVQKMAHNPAILFNIDKRGFIDEGCYADLVLVKKQAQHVDKSTLLYKCGWSPFEGHTFSHSIHSTFVNGHVVYSNGQLVEGQNGQRLKFNFNA